MNKLKYLFLLLLLVFFCGVAGAVDPLTIHDIDLSCRSDDQTVNKVILWDPESTGAVVTLNQGSWDISIKFRDMFGKPLYRSEQRVEVGDNHFVTLNPTLIAAVATMKSMSISTLRRNDPDLVAYYPMNGNFNDESGNGYNLIPSFTGQTFSADDQIVSLNTSFGRTITTNLIYGAASARLPSDTTGGMTICGFMKKKGGNNYMGTLFGFGNNAYKSPRVMVEFPWGELTGSVGDRTKEKYQRIHDGNWHHVAIVVPAVSSGVPSYDVYVDGVKVLYGPISRLPAYGTFNVAAFYGADVAGVGVDEVRVYKRALSGAEIAQVIRLAQEVRDPTLLAYFPMNGNFNDESGNGYNLIPYSPNQLFSSDTLLSADNQCFGVTSSSNISYGAYLKGIPSDTTNGFTLCGFMKKTGGNNYKGTLMGFGTNVYKDPRLLVEFPYGEMTTSVGDKTKEKYKRLPDTSWHHIAMVVPPLSSANTTYDVYMDGVRVTGGILTRFPSCGTFNVAAFSGADVSGICVDEIRLYTRALAVSELAKLASQNHDASAPVSPSTNAKSRLAIHPISRDWICVVGNYNDFERAKVLTEHAQLLRDTDLNKASMPDWKYEKYYRAAVRDTIFKYRPQIKANFENPAYFKVAEVGSGNVGIAENGYWLNAIGRMSVNTLLSGDKIFCNDAEVVHYAYLHLSTPLLDGSSYQIRTSENEVITFSYNEKQLISYALKVNQVGYLPDAGRKYGYLGLWLGDKGTLDLSSYSGKPFYIVDTRTGSSVFSGSISLRMADKTFTSSSGVQTPVTGEDVYEMDFSSFSTPGEYFIYVPGIGRSWSFRVASDVLADAFYIHAKGLYQQRCGIAKEKPYTNWTLGACHTQTYTGGFEPNDQHYNARTDEYGYRDEQDAAITLNHFDVVRETATTQLLPAVKGGWHDAADYDRRPYHFGAVQDLLAAYMMFPNKFVDGQLNIPESGNGIPDIIDEAAWGMDVWRAVQNDKGGVGCWIEATSHPQDINPATDVQPFYTSLPTCAGSMEYAAYAAMLARAYKLAGKADKEALYYNSALKAFNYALDRANLIDYSWSHQSSSGEMVTYSYREAPDAMRKSHIFKAALNLYYLSGKDPRFVTLMQENENGVNDGYYYDVYNMHWKLNPFSFVELLLARDDFPAYTTAFTSRIMAYSEELLGQQELQAYRDINWDPSSPKFTSLAWGASVALRKGRALAVAYDLTGDARYRNSLLLLNDWQNGASPMGRTWTTGLGSVAPVKLLHNSSLADGIVEPQPGITMYGITGGLSYNGRKLVNSLSYDADPAVDFPARYVSLIPASLSSGRNDLTYDEVTAILGKNIPIWRRFWNIEDLEVAQNEFTIWETISPCIAITGIFIPDGWLPGTNLTGRQPINKLEDLPGYEFQP